MNFKLPPFAIFEDTLTKGSSYYFYDPITEIVAYDEKSLQEAFIELEDLQSQGLYLAGFISYEASYYSYEASYYINKKLAHLRTENDGKLLHFVAFKSYLNKIPNSLTTNATIDLMVDGLSIKDYQKSFNDVQQALINGESYQINLTKNIYAKTSHSSHELYNRLKQLQPVKYAAYLPFLEPDIISISPELFFKKEGKYLIVRPMKGTARLTNDIEKNQEIYEELKACQKNKSENLIIVDLLRNDLSGIAKNHTVKVDKLFDIEKYNSLLQITSQISAKVDNGISFKKILDSLFPCGSITGAPKIRTQELISSIEKDKRNAYTGSLGYILPNNDMCFNVAIRTLEKNNDTIKLGVGGGITVYSDYQSEWLEMMTKIGFIKQIYHPKFSIIESIYFCNDFKLLDLHIQRLCQTAERLFFNIDSEKISNDLISYAKKLNINTEYKIRLEYRYDNSVEICHTEIDNTKIEAVKLIISPEKIDSTNKLFRYKTTHDSTRGFYTEMHNKYIASQENKELLFLNEFGNITETRFHNILIEKDGQKYTPLLTDGVLDGVARKTLIEKENLITKSINLDELKAADKIYLINSVRGFIPAYLDN
ncbi:bifunctional anthranilate synthase component I family protein/class IV aminotransferase [Francisellaceae bacterium CB299]